MDLDLVAVGIGGFFGALARYAVGIWTGPSPGGFPYGTLIVNLSGCFCLAWLFTASPRFLRFSPRLKPAVGAGFLGGFTTFSAFSAETLQFFFQHQWGAALFYVFASVFGCLGFAILGSKMGGGGWNP